MGRTIPSFRIALDNEISSYKPYKNRLQPSSTKYLESLFDLARNFCSAASCSVRPVVSEGMFMAIIFGHEKILAEISSKIEQIRLIMDGNRRG